MINEDKTKTLPCAGMDNNQHTTTSLTKTAIFDSQNQQNPLFPEKDIAGQKTVVHTSDTPNGVGSDSISNKKRSFKENLFDSLLSLYRGWNCYMKYDVAPAGWALAFLYFTVLGLDNITMGL